MHLLEQEEFIAKKKSDTLAVMGCGFSINQIPTRQWNYIHNEFDSFGMNWFCNAARPTTFYLIREQCVAPKKLEVGSEVEDLYDKINAIDTTLIVKENHGKADDYFHVEHLDKYDKDGIIVKDIVGRCGADAFNEDIFESGLRHGKCTIYDALHFAVFMGYKRVIFCGIDLYDSRYFWLGPNETREIVANDGNDYKTIHQQRSNTIEIIESMKLYYSEIELLVQNPMSALANIVEVWKV